MLARDGDAASEPFKRLRAGTSHDRAFRLLRHAAVQFLLAADGLAAALESPRRCPWLKFWLPRRLIEMTGPLLSPTAVGHLQRELGRRDKSRHAMSASLLHATGTDWIPDGKVACDLTGAYLAGSHWAGLRLKELAAGKCDLSGSDLTGSVFENLAAFRANFSRATLRDALLINLCAPEAVFHGADLSSIKAENAILESADFTEANVSGACLDGAAPPHCAESGLL